MCSMMIKRIVMKNGRIMPKISQISIIFIYEVGGRLDDTELLSVYITSIIVTANERLV